MKTQGKELDNRIIRIAEKIKKLRINKGYSSAETFSYDYDLPRVQYWRLEKGTNFTITNLLKILDIHEISMKEFFKDID